MKPKLMLLATAVLLLATNAQAAGFLTPESQRCTGSRPHGIFRPSDTWLGNCDVAANRAQKPK
jgi:hypothetical protein